MGGWDGMRELGSRIFKSLDGVDESCEISLRQEQLPREEGKASGLNIQEPSLRSWGKEACFAPTWRRRGVGTLTPLVESIVVVTHTRRLETSSRK